MALTQEDLQAIATMMDSKLQPIHNRLDSMENRLDSMENRLDRVENRLDDMEGNLKLVKLRQDNMARKLNDLQLDVKIAEREIRRDIRDLNDEMETVIEVMKMNELILVLHPVSNRTFSTAYFAIYCVVVSQRCHRIASFLRLAD